MKKWICVLLVLQLISLNVAMAQENSEDDVLKNTQNDIFLVAGAGLGGAILGLSTLSFYDKASEHIANVWTGAAIGIIAGVIFVAYSSAQKGSDELQSAVPSEGFSTAERVAWHGEKSKVLSVTSVQFGTQFWQTSF